MDSFANRLRQGLESRNMSQAELARRSGIGRNSISDYLKGKYEAKQDYVHRLAQAMDINEAWLMGFEDVEMTKPNITSVFNKLVVERQQYVYDVAVDQLKQQTANADRVGDNIVPLPTSTTDVDPLTTIAAHIDDDATDEDRRAIQDFIAKIKREREEHK